jgi:hypothetical protein
MRTAKKGNKDYFTTTIKKKITSSTLATSTLQKRTAENANQSSLLDIDKLMNYN